MGLAGPYRALFTDLCRELQTLQSDSDPYPLRLLCPTPNRAGQLGEGRDKYTVNAALVSPHHAEQFEFLGRIMGVRGRTAAGG
jgi:hypothetical protein